MILTCEERQVIFDEIHFLPHKGVLDPYLKAQLKKVYEWGKETCKEHRSPVMREYDRFQLRRDCVICWQALLGEIQ